MKVIITYEELAHAMPISFTVLKGRTIVLSCTGFIYSNRHSHFVILSDNNNRIVFDALGIDAQKFVQEITGEYDMGSWPESSTLDKLGKVLEALKCFHEL